MIGHLIIDIGYLKVYESAICRIGKTGGCESDNKEPRGVTAESGGRVGVLCGERTRMEELCEEH